MIANFTNPFLKALVNVVLCTFLGPIGVVVFLLAVVLGIFLLLLVESFAKQISSLILYGELSAEMENPADKLLYEAFRIGEADKRP